jgi:hypothetical protein
MFTKKSKIRPRPNVSVLTSGLTAQSTHEVLSTSVGLADTIAAQLDHLNRHPAPNELSHLPLKFPKRYIVCEPANTDL